MGRSSAGRTRDIAVLADGRSFEGMEDSAGDGLTMKDFGFVERAVGTGPQTIIKSEPANDHRQEQTGVMSSQRFSRTGSPPGPTAPMPLANSVA